GAYGEGSFDRIDSTVYIYCPAGTTCSDVDSRNKPLPGNVSAPLQTIVGAVRLARALGAYEVRIAGRGDGEAYREHVLSGTLDLYGGYDASFTEATRWQTPTIIEDDDGAALFVFGSSTLETVIEDLTLRSARSAALVIASGLNLHINRNDISGGTLGIDASGVTNLLVTGNTIHSYPGSNGSGMRIASSVGVVTDNTIVVETCGAGPCNDPVGVDIDFTSLLFSDNAITVASSGASVNHRGIRIRDGFVEIERNRVSVGDGPSAALEFIGNPYLGASMIRNNILMTGQTLSGSTETYGILAYDPVLMTAQAIFLAVANNLIYAGGGVGTAKAVSDALIGSIYVNNIMLTGPGTNRYCLYENWADLKIADFRNNLLLECPTALYRDVNTSGSTNRTAIADVNIEANTTQTGESASVGGNVTAASLAAVGFVDFPTNVHLTAGTAASIRLGGFNAALNACGLSDFWGCGSVRDDLAKVPRTCPAAGVDCYSIGPYELDP
ncbi:MAG TPA: right-handed parallel beta-helix repeat-containing protein, partial [Myxococcota bacterium]|nr:right-handed parallel beta-helix repeat-containing protein [Myxococcota bacterium]